MSRFLLDYLAFKDFSIRVDVLPWDRPRARRCGIVRAHMEASGKILAPMDLLIAIQALEEEAILVAHDEAFKSVPGLTLENCTEG